MCCSVCFKICGCRVHITYVLFCLFQDLRMSCTHNVCVVLFVSRFAMSCTYNVCVVLFVSRFADVVYIKRMCCSVCFKICGCRVHITVRVVL